MKAAEILQLRPAEMRKAWAKIPLSVRKTFTPEDVNAITTAIVAAGVRGKSAAELLAESFPEVRKVCGDFIQEGVTILGAAPKTGKTTLMRQACAAVAGEREFLGEPCEPGRGLFLSLEEGERLFQKKLRPLCLDGETASRIDLHFAWPQGIEGCERLDKYLNAAPGVRLAVIDSLTRFRQPATKGANQFELDYAALAGLADVAKKHPGLAVVVIHHTRKVRGLDPMDDISGTYGLTAAADAWLVLRKEGRGATLAAGGRLWDREDNEFTLERQDHRWRLVGISDGLTDKERQVLQTLRDSGGMGPTDLAKVLGIGRTTAFQFLDQLLAKGKVSKQTGFYVAI